MEKTLFKINLRVSHHLRAHTKDNKPLGVCEYDGRMGFTIIVTHPHMHTYTQYSL